MLALGAVDVYVWPLHCTSYVVNVDLGACAHSMLAGHSHGEIVPSWGDVRDSLTPGLDVSVLWVTVLPSQGDPSHPGGYSLGRFDPPPGQWATSAARCKVHCCD